MQNVNCDKAEAYLKSLIPHFPEGSVKMGFHVDEFALHMILDAPAFANGRTGTCYSIPVTCKYRKIRGLRTIVWVIGWLDVPTPLENSNTSDKYGTNIEKLVLLYKRAIEYYKEHNAKVAMFDLHRTMIKNFFAAKFNEKYVIRDIKPANANDIGLYTLNLNGQGTYPDMNFNVTINGNKLTAHLNHIDSVECLANSEIVEEIKRFEVGMKNEIKNIVDRYRDMIIVKINPFK